MDADHSLVPDSPPTRNSPEFRQLQMAVLQGDEDTVTSLVNKGLHIDEQTTKDMNVHYTICKKCVCDIKDRSCNSVVDNPIHDDSSGTENKRVDELFSQNNIDLDSELKLLYSANQDSNSVLLLNGSILSETTSASDTIGITFCCNREYKHADSTGISADLRTKVEICRGSTVLHLAVLINNFKMADLLLTLGARFDLENSQSHTVLHLASKLDNVDILKLLSRHSQDLYLVNSNKNTPLHTAATYSSINAVKYILGETTGQNISLINRFGKHPVHIAIQNNNVEILKLLMSSRGPNNDYDNLVYGTKRVQNALHFAVILNSPECGQFLIDCGYDVNGCDSYNMPFLRIASRFGLHRMTSLLLHNGAKVRVHLPKGQTALDTALEMTYLDQILILLSAGAMFCNRTENNKWAIEQMDMNLCLSCDSSEKTIDKFRKLLLFGYKFSEKVLLLTKTTGSGITHPWDNTIQLILTFSKNPLALQRMAANTIIRTLSPNAWVSRTALPLPSALLGYLVQDQHSLH